MRRFLKRNKGTEAPTNFLFFDTESHEPAYFANGRTREHRLRLWVAIACRLEKGEVTRREVCRGRSAAGFWEFLDSRCHPHTPLWAVAHNLGYDWTQLDFWGELWGRRYTIGPIKGAVNPETGRKARDWRGILCAEASPTFAVVRGPKGTVKFTDTHNYWPFPLSAIGKTWGLAKLEMPKWEASDDEWFQYCERDVEVAEKAFLGLVRKWVKERCGVFQLTGPMLALTNYMHTSEVLTADGTKCNLVLDNEHEAIPLERDAYLGGRIEAFYVGELAQRLWHLDCNSLYPAMMSSELYPRDRVSCGKIDTPDQLRRVVSSYGAVADVRINARGNTYPVVRDGVQWHVTGHFDTTLAGPELRRALDSGDVEQVGRVQCYSMARLFKGWVETWYARKCEARARGDAGIADMEFAQLILRSLSAKWAQGGDFWADRPALGWMPKWETWCEFDADKEEMVWWRSVAGIAQQMVLKHEPRHSFPAISAFITAHAREYMRGVIRSLPAQSVYYSNTDSLIVDERGFRALKRNGLVDDTALGLFRVKGEHTSAEIRGLNCFRLDSTWTRSGLHGKAKEVEGKGLISEAWQNLPSILRHYPDGAVLVEEHPFAETKRHYKGTRGKDGWVRPKWITLSQEWTDRLPCHLPRESARTAGAS